MDWWPCLIIERGALAGGNGFCAIFVVSEGDVAATLGSDFGHGVETFAAGAERIFVGVDADVFVGCGMSGAGDLAFRLLGESEFAEEWKGCAGTEQRGHALADLTAREAGLRGCAVH